MSVATFIADAGTIVAIEAVAVSTTDPTATTVPGQTAIGGVDSASEAWGSAGVGCDAVPCLINVMSTTRVNQNNSISYETLARIYLNNDPVPGGLNISHRLRVLVDGKAGPHVEGIWMVTGVQDPIPFGDHIEVQAMRIGLP